MQIKTASVLSFEPGSLEIYGKGYGEKPGSGCITFDEDDVELVEHDDKSGTYFKIELSQSELLEIAHHISVNSSAT